MEIENAKEHEDGSVTYVIEMTNEEINIMAKEGVKLAILLGICELTYEGLAKKLIDERTQADSV